MQKDGKDLRNPPSRRTPIVDKVHVPLEAMSDAKFVWIHRDGEIGRVMSIEPNGSSAEVVTIHSVGHIEGVSRREVKFSERNVCRKVVVTHGDSIELIR